MLSKFISKNSYEDYMAKILLNNKLKAIQNTNFKLSDDSNKEMLVKDAIVFALHAQDPDAKDISMEESIRNYRLLRKVDSASEEADFSSEEISLIKKKVHKTYGQDTLRAQICLLLEGEIL